MCVFCCVEVFKMVVVQCCQFCYGGDYEFVWVEFFGLVVGDFVELFGYCYVVIGVDIDFVYIYVDVVFDFFDWYIIGLWYFFV